MSPLLLTLLLAPGWRVLPEPALPIEAVEAPTPERRLALSELARDLMLTAPVGTLPADLGPRLEALGLRVSEAGDVAWLEDGDPPRGTPVLGVRLGERAAPLVLCAPHPYFDRHTGVIASRMFQEQPVRALLVATVRRDAGPDTDAAHAPRSAWQALTDGLSLGDPDALVVQLHGFAPREGEPPGVLISPGQTWWTPAQLDDAAARLSAALDGADVRVAPPGHRLAGLTNSQGRMLAGRAHVLLIELDPALRERLRDDAEARAALYGALAETAAEVAP